MVRLQDKMTEVWSVLVETYLAQTVMNMTVYSVSHWNCSWNKIVRD